LVRVLYFLALRDTFPRRGFVRFDFVRFYPSSCALQLALKLDPFFFGPPLVFALCFSLCLHPGLRFLRASLWVDAQPSFSIRFHRPSLTLFHRQHDLSFVPFFTRRKIFSLLYWFVLVPFPGGEFARFCLLYIIHPLRGLDTGVFFRCRLIFVLPYGTLLDVRPCLFSVPLPSRARLLSMHFGGLRSVVSSTSFLGRLFLFLLRMQVPSQIVGMLPCSIPSPPS